MLNGYISPKHIDSGIKMNINSNPFVSRKIIFSRYLVLGLQQMDTIISIEYYRSLQVEIIF